MKQTTTDTSAELAKWLGGAAAGALLMYMLDPDRGGARRAQSVSAVRGVGTRTSGALGNLWRGAGARPGATADEARERAGDALEAAKPDGAADKASWTLSRLGKAAGDMLDDTLSRTKGALGRGDSVADDSTARASSAIARAGDVAGDVYEQASRIASRFGGRFGGPFARALRGDKNGAWTPAMRNTALLGGGLLALTGLMRRSPMGLLLGLGGAALLARGAANQPLRGLMSGVMRGRGLGMGLDQPIDFEKSIHIDAAPDEVYDAFANYENFPRFMSHLVDVRDLGRRRSHWTVKGPGGSEFEWTSVITEQSRPHRLAWRSEPGAEIPQTGSIQLEPHRGGTDVTVRMSYTPPAGALGHGLATLLGADPESRMDEDLAHMKAYIEHGTVPRASASQSRTGSRFLH